MANYAISDTMRSKAGRAGSLEPARHFREPQHQTDPARGDRSHTRSDLIACSRPAQHWTAIVVAALILALKPPLDLAFENS